MSEQSPRVHKFEAEVSQVLSLVINSLYSNKEIFARELLSNASDALDKLRFEALQNPQLLADEPTLRVRVTPDEQAGTITIEDTGIGMTQAELIENLGTIAHSGSRAFLTRIKAAQDAAQRGDLSLIGQFGVGFYSSFLIADRVEVISKAAGSDEAWRWVSDAQDTYTIEPATRDGRGTTLILHVKEDQREYLSSWRLRSLIERYADYVSHPIELPVEVDAEDGEAQVAPAYEQVNRASALWQRSASELTDEQYADFYKHLTRDWQPPLTRAHFSIEGTQQFKGLLFVPSQPPFDMHDRDSRHGVRLYVKRVFIMEDCKELLPQWLRFVRGVVDSDDLPLNVSRELLQDSRVARTIEKQVTRKALGMLEELAKDRPEDYLNFWGMFGRVLKEGLHFSPEHADRLMKLVRFESSKVEGLTSLAEYVERMPEGQASIYYALGATRKLLEGSPNLEALKKRDYEVLYLTDAVDQWAVMGMNEFEGKKLVAAMTETLDLGDEQDEAQKQALEEKREGLKGLTDRFASVLTERIQEVRVSQRLVDAPVCLVTPEGGMASHIERMLRANDQDVPSTRRILEVNPDHPVIKHLDALQGRDEARAKNWIELLYDQALIAEGSPVDDPSAFTRRVTDLLSEVASR